MPQSSNGSLLSSVLSLPVEEQEAGGFRHTLQEIRQQPELWEITARQIAPLLDRWRGLLEKSRAVVFTGSGSSHYAGECLVHAVQRATGLPACVISSGELLLLRDAALPPIRPLLMVSFARSGDSPESAELIRRLLEDEPEVRHLVITCNRHGRLAEIWGAEGLEPCSRVEIVTLDDRTCDRSLVMTSSFTNLALAGLGLAYVSDPTGFLAAAAKLALLGNELLVNWSDRLAEVAAGSYRRMIVLGDGSGYGAARESALKTLEMTDGRVATMAETTLGFRHGPMCSLHRDALLVMFLSSDLVRRAYQLDLLEEIQRKGLGGQKILVGGNADFAPLEKDDLTIGIGEPDDSPDEWAALLCAVIGQLLAFFRCRAEGLRPDEPAANGAISRVVSEFRFHTATHHPR
jgi:D-galactosamine 6-phosphate deaminase/isomerase